MLVYKNITKLFLAVFFFFGLSLVVTSCVSTEGASCCSLEDCSCDADCQEKCKKEGCSKTCGKSCSGKKSCGDSCGKSCDGKHKGRSCDDSCDHKGKSCDGSKKKADGETCSGKSSAVEKALESSGN